MPEIVLEEEETECADDILDTSVSNVIERPGVPGHLCLLAGYSWLTKRTRFLDLISWSRISVMMVLRTHKDKKVCRKSIA